MSDIVERLREEAARDDLAYRTVTILADAALRIEQLEDTLKDLASRANARLAK